MIKLFIQILFIVLILIPSISYGCRDTSDYVVFASDTRSKNSCYAISLPPNALSNKTGKTSVHVVEDGEDKVAFSFDGYSRNIHLKCGNLVHGSEGISLVRSLAAVHYKVLTVEDYDLLEFYLNGKLVKKYTARELTSGEGSYWPATSCGDRIIWGEKLEYSDGGRSSLLRVQFALRLVDFDLTTGEIIKIQDKPEKTWLDIQRSFSPKDPDGKK